MSNAKKTDQIKKRRMAWVIGIIIITLIGLLILQNSNSSSAIDIAPTGGAPSVFIDRAQMRPLQSTSSATTYNVSSGSHEVLIAEDGHWPWSDQVTVAEDETVEIKPFLIEQTGKRVIQTTSEITGALEDARQQSVPSSETPLISPNENISIFVAGESNIIAQWTAGTSSAPDYFNCERGTCGVSVYDQEPIRQIDFYPNRNDVIFFATDTGVYAIEIDPSGETQNFQPVVETAIEPVFTIDGKSIFVLSGDRITVNGI